MVKIIRKLAFMDTLKESYYKSFWGRIKHLWSEFHETNPLVATYATLTAVVCIPGSILVGYLKYHANPVPRYFDHIRIYRPDDPRVASIRKDDCLMYGQSITFDSIHMPDTI